MGVGALGGGQGGGKGKAAREPEKEDIPSCRAGLTVNTNPRSRPAPHRLGTLISRDTNKDTS